MALDVKTNIGEIDQKIRYAVGGVLVLMALVWGSVIVFLLGLVVIGTAWFGWCPPYDLLGINTTQLKSKDIIDIDALSNRALSSEGWCAFLNGSNLGDDGRSWRYGLGAFALLFGYAFSSFFWFLIGFVLFATAISTRCPLYHILGFNSQDKAVKDEKSAAELSAEVFEVGVTEKIDAAPIEAKEADITATKPAQKAKKPAEKKAATKPQKAKVKPVSKAAPAAKAKKKTPKKNDLTMIEGVGPKISEILQKGGVTDFSILASTDHAKIKEMLMAEGSRYAMHDPETWPEQAAMARDEKWEALKKWQDKYKGGRKK